MERLIEKVVIEGAEFEIIQKPETLYAGYKAEADNGGEESSIDTGELFQAGYKSIKNSLTPDSMLCLSINYKECNHGKNARRFLMHCQETLERNQPEGITVLESPACYMIKVKSSEATWALVKKTTGEDEPSMAHGPAFRFVRKTVL